MWQEKKKKVLQKELSLNYWILGVYFFNISVEFLSGSQNLKEKFTFSEEYIYIYVFFFFLTCWILAKWII